MTINKEQAVSDAMIEAGRKAFFALDRKDGQLTPQSVVNIYLAMKAASHPLEQQQAVSGDVVERVALVRLHDNSGRCIEDVLDRSEIRAALTASGMERMREILEPLAEKAKRIDDSVYWTERRGDGFTVAIPLGVCRKARTALQGGE